uniref:U4/U6.U5 small nuclear ribonucleoprotein 27 kDa protein n=1 Tax=Ixodes ricinus TaxID=34613 RepID=A0A090XEJ7_IXORI
MGRSRSRSPQRSRAPQEQIKVPTSGSGTASAMPPGVHCPEIPDSATRDADRERERERRPARERHRSRSCSSSPRPRNRSPRRRRSRSPRRRSRSPRRRSRSRERKEKGDQGTGAVPKFLLERPAITAKDLEGKSEEEKEMMKIMGFGSFDSSKGKHIPGNNVYAVHVIHKRKYRQYMNRKGGFNRPLDYVA